MPRPRPPSSRDDDHNPNLRMNLPIHGLKGQSVCHVSQKFVPYREKWDWFVPISLRSARSCNGKFFGGKKGRSTSGTLSVQADVRIYVRKDN